VDPLTSSRPLISVVIPTLRKHAVLARCLAALEAQRIDWRHVEVILVEDAASIDVPAVGGVRTLRASRPGASAARNCGWQNARAPVVLFLDDDIVAGPDLVHEHWAWHEREPGEDVGVLGHVEWARELRVTPFMRWVDDGRQFDYGSIRGHEAHWWHLYTANVSVKRSLLEHVGGFDEVRFPFGYEDLDLGRRMYDTAGFRLLYNRRASAEHLAPVTLEDWQRRIGRIAMSERRFVETYPDADAYFYKLFSEAAALPPARSRGARLAGLVPRWVPLLGPRVHASADWYFRQALAPGFLEAWEAAGVERRRATTDA
jgi:glycosyltransferase involved in cell wall biosynthesis